MEKIVYKTNNSVKKVNATHEINDALNDMAECTDCSKFYVH